ncbi:MAG: endoribonuclease MazF [Candidatus Xenobiia bacterium LiM19]
MVDKEGFIPDRGDIVELLFSPQQGHEQSGRRPALILSPIEYNARTSLCIACPITSKKRGYPFEVSIPDGYKTRGVILADQVKSLDWRCRKAALIEKVSEPVFAAVAQRILLLIN